MIELMCTNIPVTLLLIFNGRPIELPFKQGAQSRRIVHVQSHSTKAVMIALAFKTF